MLCAALVTGPEVRLLDEPTSGLEVPSARLIRQIVRHLNRDGLTVFLTTHNMDEAEEMCPRLAIIHQGRLAAIDTPEALRSRVRTSQYGEVRFDGPPPAEEQRAVIPAVSRAAGEGAPAGSTRRARGERRRRRCDSPMRRAWPSPICARGSRAWRISSFI